jgi:hypothetical protein
VENLHRHGEAVGEHALVDRAEAAAAETSGVVAREYRELFRREPDGLFVGHLQHELFDGGGHLPHYLFRLQCVAPFRYQACDEAAAPIAASARAAERHSDDHAAAEEHEGEDEYGDDDCCAAKK